MVQIRPRDSVLKQQKVVDDNCRCKYTTTHSRPLTDLFSSAVGSIFGSQTHRGAVVVYVTTLKRNNIMKKRVTESVPRRYHHSRLRLVDLDPPLPTCYAPINVTPHHPQHGARWGNVGICTRGFYNAPGVGERLACNPPTYPH